MGDSFWKQEIEVRGQGALAQIKPRKKARVEILSELGRVYSLQSANGATIAEQHYRIYSFTFGAGVNRQNYLVTYPFESKNLGSNELYLRPLSSSDALEFFENDCPEPKILFGICKEQGIQTHALTEEREKRLLAPNELVEKIKEHQQQSPFLFTETLGVDGESLKFLTDEQWQQQVHDFLCEGWEKDLLIEQIYKSDLIEPNPELIRPKNFMPYTPHSLIFTNSKTGKTTTGKKTAISVESARVANLLGFSTAQEKIEGSLNNQTKTLRIDEIQEEKNDELYSALSTYMEQGECEIRKGKSKVNVKGFAAISWQGNPKLADAPILDLMYDEKPEDLFQKVADCLRIISRNNQAFGGRIGEFVFRLDVKTAQAPPKGI